MDARLSTQLRKIQLSRSEPVLGYNKIQHDKKSDMNRYAVRNKFTTRFYSKTQSNALSSVKPHPPTFDRPNLTVVSPKRRIRVSFQLHRTSGDGESSRQSCEEDIANNSDNSDSEESRLPGDGCYSDTDSDCSSKQDDDSILDVDQALGENDEFGEDDEIVDEEDDGDSTFDMSSPFSSSLSLNTEECVSVVSSSTSLRLHPSSSSLKDTSPLPLLQSLFSNKPPTLYFTTEGEKISPLPPEIRKILKWKYSTVMPKVVKSCVTRTGFQITKKNNEWLGVWGKHMKAATFKNIKVTQKVNHFPGTFHIGRKDKLSRSFTKMIVLHGKKEFNFLPQTFILPQDVSGLRKAWNDANHQCKWIVKPPASARGIGIKIINKWSQVPKKRPTVVQKYLVKPYLINGRKFDLRIYVFVASYDPLRVYIFEDGLVRFATSKYSTSSKSLSNKYAHLTNYSINKNNTSVYVSSTNEGEEDHKWSLHNLWCYLRKRGVNTDKLWGIIKDISLKAIICGEAQVSINIKQNMKSRHSCFELFGLDILLDHNLKAWLLEVNISPSLHSNSELDRRIKGELVKDIFNICGFFLPKTLFTSLSKKSSNVDEFSAASYWLKQKSLSSDEKLKQKFYIQKFQDSSATSTILDVITPDDLLMLMETEDEFSRCGSFERIIPAPHSKSYLSYLETPRYYNLLLDEWTKQYMRDTPSIGLGVSILRNLSSKGLHLYCGNQVNPNHQWSLSQRNNPTYRSLFISSSRHASSSASSLPNIRRKKKKISSSAIISEHIPRGRRQMTCTYPKTLSSATMKTSAEKFC